MSRPRRPFGTNRPGQLLATRVKVLAAELSDRDRLRRGRAYATDGSVIDITITHGVATGSVLGSRSDPYLAELMVDDGEGPPGRDEVTATCTCPDDDLQARSWCKHAIATLLVIADEVAIDPAVLDRWRGVPLGDDDDEVAIDGTAASGDTGIGHALGRRGSGVTDLAARRKAAGASGAPGPDIARSAADDAESDPEASALQRSMRPRLVPPPNADPLADLLAVPDSAELPVIPDIERIGRHPVTDPALDTLIATARAALTGDDGTTGDGEDAGGSAESG